MRFKVRQCGSKIHAFNFSIILPLRITNYCWVKTAQTVFSWSGPDMPVLERWKLQWESSSPKRQAAQHSEQTLKTALNSKHPVRVSQYETQQHLMEDFQTDNGLFGPITLHLHQIGSPLGAPQDFEHFFGNPYRKSPSSEKCSMVTQGNGSPGKHQNYQWKVY